ncbi:MAG: outer membrane protein assembly factor BamD [Succinivibrio sp.]|nr:outer membrane protein assembly factor BamD [Succinivibrio sp.]
MLKKLCPLLISLSIVMTGCSSSSEDTQVPDLSAEQLYNVAKSDMATGNFSGAQKYLEALDSRYPFGELTDQVQLDLIYVYYKQRNSAMTTAAINRYLRLNPTGQYSDYVTYMKGLNEIQMRSDMLQDFIGLNRSQKDPTNYYAALNTFKDLINTYPSSPYVKDARQRMIYIKQQLAEREYKIAQYYFEREAYLSSIRHCQSILYAYRDTSYLEPSLKLMSKGYRKLGLEMPAQNVDKVVSATYYKQ